MSDFYPVCSGCGWSIDPDICHCGEGRGAEHDNHCFVPNGCTCLYTDAVQRSRRYVLIRERLEKLSPEQIQSIIDNIDLICFDTFNFDEIEKKYCPLAVAHKLHVVLKFPTDDKVKLELAKTYEPVNVLKGVPGTFYRKNRRQDLLDLCRQMLADNSVPVGQRDHATPNDPS